MASYQVMCSVTRPPEPAGLCRIDQFSSKVQRHINAVFQDIVLTAGDGNNSGNNGQHGHLGGGVDDGGGGGGVQSRGENLLCALVSKTSISFPGNDKFPSSSKVKMPFFWCNLCPFDTESKASMLNHVVSQHLFICQFCPYVAVSRCDVVQHGLSQHPQSFQQFRDQKLKGCLLRRPVFIQHFQPEAVPMQQREEGGSGAQNAGESQGESGQGQNVELKVEQQDEGVGDSSSSDSADELPLHFHSSERDSASHAVPAAGDEQNTCTESEGENVVSSSMMEPDSGLSASESASATTLDGGSTALETISPEIPLSQPQSQDASVSAISQASMSSSLSSPNCQLIHPTSVIKQEKDAGLTGFARALGKTIDASRPADRTSSANRQNSIVKQEPMVGWSENLDTNRNDVQGHLRPSSSPPLSTIRPESLQQQLEQFFRVQTVLNKSVYPHPINMYTQANRKDSSPSLVENFLLDPSNQGSSPSTSMLRSLLTCPKDQTANEGDKEAPSNSKALAPEEERNLRESNDNFLLAPVDTDCTREKDEVGKVSKKPEDNPVPFVKQEPMENAAEFSHALMSSFSQEMKSLQATQEKQAQSPSLSSPPLRPAAAESPRITPEKLKSYSNMSLRDLLTINTADEFMNPTATPAAGRQTSSTLFPARGMQPCASGVNDWVQSDDDTAGGDIVRWECGFCNFAHQSKRIVMSHRQLYHAIAMAEAGFTQSEEEGRRDDDYEDDREEDWVNQGAEEEEDEAQNWRDQASSDYRCQRLLMEYAQAASSSHGNARPKAIHRSMRTKRFDDDFEWQSPESSAYSDSENETAEDLKDKNYEPPKNVTADDAFSSDEERSKRPGPSGGPRKRRGRPPGSKNRSKHGQISKVAERGGRIDKSKLLCPYCSHYPANVQELKNHILHVTTSTSANESCKGSTRHLLMVRQSSNGDGSRGRYRHPDTFYYICPNDRCTELFPETPSKDYLNHVLKCQGHVLDAQEASARAIAAQALDKAERVAGFINCPVNNCYFVTPSHQQMDTHLGVHIRHIHSVQGLLFSTMCSAMAKAFGDIDGFDRLICYRCGTMPSSLAEAIHHMSREHSGMVRGVLHICQTQDDSARGIVVSVRCLACLQSVPTLNRWFIHRCPVGPEAPARDPSVPPYVFRALVLPFTQWVWRVQYKYNNPINLSTPRPQSSVTGKPEGTDQSSSSGGQLPLIRSILLGQSVDMPSQKQQPQQKKRETEEDEVTPVVQCQECHHFVPEDQWKQHSCFVKALIAKHIQKPDSKKATTSSSETITAGAAVSDLKNTPHSTLLTCLASRHQSDMLASSASHSASAGLSSSPAFSSKSSNLVSLLTNSNHIPGGQLGKSTTTSSHPSTSGSTIRSLLTLSTLDSTWKLKEIHSNGSDGEQGGGAGTKDHKTGQVSGRSARLRSRKSKSSEALGTPEEPAASLTKRRRRGNEEPANGDAVVDLSLPHKRDSEDAPSASKSAPALSQPQGLSAARTLQSLATEVVDSGTQGDSESTSPTQGAHQGFMNFLHQQGDQMRQVLGSLDDQQENCS